MEGHLEGVEGTEQNQTLPPIISYPDLLTPFSGQQNLIEFVASRPALQEILKEVPQCERK